MENRSTLTRLRVRQLYLGIPVAYQTLSLNPTRNYACLSLFGLAPWFFAARTRNKTGTFLKINFQRAMYEGVQHIREGYEVCGHLKTFYRCNQGP